MNRAPHDSQEPAPKADPAYPQFGIRKLVEAGDRAITEHESVMAEGGICRGNAMHSRQVALRVLETLGIEPEAEGYNARLRQQVSDLSTEVQSLEAANERLGDVLVTALQVFRHAERNGFINVNESPMFDLMAKIKACQGDLT